MIEKARAEVASHNMCSLCLSLCRRFSCIIPDSSRYSFVIYEFLRTSVLGFLVMSINKNWINISHLSHLSWPSPCAGPASIWVIQYFRSCAMSSVSRYFFMSPCMLSLHLFFGRPRLLLPETSSLSDFAQMWLGSRLKQWPNHFSLLFSRNVSTGFTWASFLISSCLMWSNLVFPLARLNILISAEFSLLSSFFFMAQHSEPFVIAGLMIVLKRGLGADPWCNPTSIGKYSVSPFCVTNCVLHDLYMSCTIWTYSSGTPFFLKHHQIRSLGILSNAFSRSTKTMCKSLFFLLQFSCSCRYSKTGSVVDIPGLKPNWLSLIFTISLSRASMTRYHRPLSRRLDRCDRVIQDEVGDSIRGNV